MILLRTLGDCAIEIGETRLAPDSEILFSLLAYFIVERGRPIAPSVLIEFFWADQDEKKARHCLRQCIYKLRRMGVPIETKNDRYELPVTKAAVDVEESNCLHRRDRLDESVISILPDFNAPHSRRYAVWVDEFRTRAQSSIRRSLIEMTGIARRRHDWRRARELARLCLAVDPMNEEATLTLAESLALDGSKDEAVRLLDAYTSDIGEVRESLRLPAIVLRTRISERQSETSIRLGVPPFEGRDGSLTLLHGLSDKARGGSGRTCLVFGDTGIGKSRLVAEFARGAALAGISSLLVRCQCNSHDRPLSIFMDLVPKLVALPGSLGCTPQGLELVTRLGRFDPTADSMPTKYGNAAQLQEATRRAVVDLVDAVCHESPLILIVEDIHWIDRVSWSLLEELIDSNCSRPLLLILTSRGTDVRRIPHEHDVRQFVLHELKALPDEACRIVATGIAARSRVELPRFVLEWCVSHSSGNPLYLLELFEHWRDTGDVGHVPASLESLIEDRLRQLSPCALQLLQASSLLGSSSTFERLEASLELPRWKILGGLAELENAGLATSLPEGIRPRHHLVEQASIAKLSEQSRRLLHLAIGEILSVQPAHSSELWDAATHFDHAGASSRALDLAMQCAAHALSMGLAHEAAELLGRAEIFATTDVDLLRLYNARREPLKITGAFEELLRIAERAVEIEESLLGPGNPSHSDNELAVLLVNAVPYVASRKGTAERAYACLTSKLATVSHRLEAALWGLAACSTDALADQADMIMARLDSLHCTNDVEHRHFLNCQLIFHTEFGSLEEAVRIGDELLDTEQRSGSASSLSRAYRVSAWPHRLRGDILLARERLTEASRLAREGHLDATYVLAEVGRAQTYRDDKDLERAARVLSELQRLLKEYPQLAVPSFFTLAAEVAVMRDDLEIAQAHVRRAEEVANAPLRYEIDRVALRVELALRMGVRTTPRELSRLRALYTRLKRYAGQQFAVGSICAGLSRLNRIDEASTTAREYSLYFRREQWPVRDARILACLEDPSCGTTS